MAMLYMSQRKNGEEWRALMEKEVPGIDFRIHPESGDPTEIEAAMVWHYGLDALRGFPNLKLVASLGAGVDHLLDKRHLIPEGATVTRLVDPSMTTQMTEWCLMALLNHMRRWEDYRRLQAERRYEEIPVPPPADVTVGVMGLGELGGDLARVLLAMGYRVRGWSRSEKARDGVACFHGRNGLAAFLAPCDVVVCLLPLTHETRDILSRETFGQMKRGAYVINAARGGHVVEEDLIAAIDEGRLSGAALDVQRAEPMPDDHPLWYHPRIVIFPHMAAVTLAQGCAPQIAENYRRMKAGKPFINVVDLERGY